MRPIKPHKYSALTQMTYTMIDVSPTIYITPTLTSQCCVNEQTEDPNSMRNPNLDIIDIIDKRPHRRQCLISG